MKKEMSMEELTFQQGSSVNKKGQTILGHLEGPCADILSPTRNGRLYSEELWEQVFNDEITKEYFSSGGIFGELGHPDRKEVDLEKIAICMPEPPKKNSHGKLIGKFDILDTPCGRILKTLCEYGYRLGISSRGNGDLETDFDGNESVIPSSYRLIAFDIVTLPAVKGARLAFTEALKRPLAVALTEALNNSSDSEKKIMVETLNELQIDYDSSKEDDNKVVTEEVIAANDDGAKILEELQKALEVKMTLETQLTESTEKLSVCYAKEKGLEEALSRKEKSIQKLLEKSKQVDPLKKRIQALEESLSRAKQQEQSITSKATSLQENLSSKVSVLNEKVANREDKIRSILKESASQKQMFEEQLGSLKRELTDVKSDSAIKNKEYQTKLSSANKLVESYKRISTDAVNRYIESQATLIGVSSKDIKSKLNEKYTLDDVDRVCDDLRKYKLNISTLPFTIGKQNRVKITESKETSIVPPSPYDDTVDASLFELLL